MATGCRCEGGRGAGEARSVAVGAGSETWLVVTVSGEAELKIGWRKRRSGSGKEVVSRMLSLDCCVVDEGENFGCRLEAVEAR